MSKTIRKHSSVDARVRHAGKAGHHHTRTRDVTKGRRRKPRKQVAKHLRWRKEA